MTTQCLGQALGLPLSWRRPAAWSTLVFCLLPVSVGWSYGILAASWLCAEAWTRLLRQRGAPSEAVGMLVGTHLFWLALACAGFGIAALWSTLVPRALKAVHEARLRRWELVGLRLGGVIALVLLTILVFNGPGRHWTGFLVWLTPTAWSLIAARCLTGESGQWLFIPPAR